MSQHKLTQLQELESESIHIMREVVAEFRNPVMLYSVGKDSSVMLHLARKAFHPGPLPFSLLHVDTGYKFKEMYEFRDWYVKEVGAKLIVHRNEDAIAKGMNPQEFGVARCCGALKTGALLEALEIGGYDAAFGGARRDEERSRAKERVFSMRDSFGQWDPKNQRPPNCGVSITAASMTVNRYVSSRYLTGPKWTSGNIYAKRAFRLCRSITPRNA